MIHTVFSSEVPHSVYSLHCAHGQLVDKDPIPLHAPAADDNVMCFWHMCFLCVVVAAAAAAAADGDTSPEAK